MKSFLVPFAMVLLASIASSADKRLPLPGETLTVAGRQAFVIMPQEPKAGKPIPWVWYAPTLPNLPGDAEKWMFEQFLAKGIAIAGIDVGESYGSPFGRAQFSELYEELTIKRNFSKKPVLLARSRGGLMLYCWAAENADKVGGVAGIYPVCNIASYPGVGKAAGAYGMSEAELQEKLTEHNPIDRIKALADAKVPILHIHGDSDGVVPLEANSAELVKRYKAHGGTGDLIVIEGQGHNMWPGWFTSERLTAFIIERALAEK